MNTEISRDELKQRMDHPRKLIVLDVLSPESYHRAHVPGAVNLPLQEIRTQAREVLPNKDQEIIVYCAGPECNASDSAAQELLEMGYSRVRRYVGGLSDWKAAGLPIASDEDRRAA